MLAATTVANEVVDMGPWIGVISQVIGWTFFIIVLLTLKSFFSYGLSIVIAEAMIKVFDDSKVEKLCRWFANGKEVLAAVREVKEKTSKKLE